MGSVTGFDIAALQFLLVAHEVPQNRWREAINAISMLSATAAKYWNEKKDN